MNDVVLTLIGNNFSLPVPVLEIRNYQVPTSFSPKVEINEDEITKPQTVSFINVKCKN